MINEDLLSEEEKDLFESIVVLASMLGYEKIESAKGISFKSNNIKKKLTLKILNTHLEFVLNKKGSSKLVVARTQKSRMLLLKRLQDEL